MTAMTVEAARRMFDEANEFYTGRAQHLHPGSEIRVWANHVYQKDTVTTLTAICAEIFRLIAEDSCYGSPTGRQG